MYQIDTLAGAGGCGARCKSDGEPLITPGSRRSVHTSPTPFRMSSTLSKPDTTARSAHRRAADQNAVLCAAQQKRFGEPPRRAGKARLHHGHTDEVFMRNGLAKQKAANLLEPLRACPKRLRSLTVGSR